MALPKHITQFMGVADTANRTTISIDPLKPFEIGRDIWRNEPEKHQLLMWMMQTAKYNPTTNSRFGHPEKAAMPGWVQFNGDTETSQDTTDIIFINGGKRLSQYSRIQNPRSGEIILFKADFDSDGYTSGDAHRNFGSSGTPLLQKGDWCKILAPNKPEGADMGKGPQQLSVYKSFRTGIVDFPVQMTGTQSAENTIEGDPFAVALNESWLMASDQMEASAVLGGAVDDNSTYTYPMHAPVGLMSYIQTNTFVLDGILTRMDFWDMVAEWKKFNKGGGAIAASSEVRQLINTWAFDKVVYDQNVQADGINISRILTPSGEFTLLESDLLGQESNLQGTLLFLPDTGIEYRPLIGAENREVAYRPVNRDEKDLKEGQIFGEYGWQFKGEERFAVATGLEF